MATVLIADDDRGIREMVRLLLEDEGHTVVEADDGLSALAVLRASPLPLVALLDCMMPRMRGPDVLAAAARDPTIGQRHAYILFTASPAALAPDVSNMAAPSSCALLPKPFDLDELLDAVAGAAESLPSPFAARRDEASAHAAWRAG